MKVSDRAITIIVAIVCLLPGFYFYFRSIQERVPTFLLDPARALIIDSSSMNLSDLAVLYKGKLVGERNVTAVRVYFWNDGKMPIKRIDVLKPLQCVLPTGTEILDSRILKISRDVTAFQILPGNATPNNAVILDFDILEKGDGAAIQIIYAGPKDSPVHFDGIVVGAPLPVVKGASSQDFLRRRFNNRQKFGVLGWIGTRKFPSILFQTWAPDSVSRFLGAFMKVSLVLMPILYICLGTVFVFYTPPTLREVPPAIVSEK